MTQRASTFTLWAAVTVLLALPASATPIDTTEDRIPVTDPSLLEELGLEPGTKNIYVTPEVHAYLLMSPAERAAFDEAAAALDEEVPSEPEASSAFGNTIARSTIHASDFAPTVVNADTDYQVGGTGVPGEELWCNDTAAGNPSTTFVGVFRDLPHGSRAVVRRFWYFDDHPTDDLTVWLQRTCVPGTGGQPETTILRMNASSGTPGYGRFGPGNAIGEDIDSRLCTYAVRVNFGGGGNCPASGNLLRFSKANLSWRRQVSPAPDTATFDDVPPGHLFFQQIEALAGSGITSGCDADSFCPGAPLTRGQMAAFLATALGLNWDEPIWEP